jgi:hypothetical protein
MTYRLQPDGSIIRESDGATIPPVEDNRDYIEYLYWVGQGNVAKPVPPVLVSTDNTFGDTPWQF